MVVLIFKSGLIKRKKGINERATAVTHDFLYKEPDKKPGCPEEYQKAVILVWFVI